MRDMYLARMANQFVRYGFFRLDALYNLADMFVRWNFSIGDFRSG